MRAAAIQLNSNQEKERNLAIAGPLVRDAAADGADLIVLPEKFNVLGSPDDLRAGAEPVPGPTTEWAGALCRELGVWLVAGSIVERVEGDDKLRNTSVLVGPDGAIHAAYRKIHLFDVEVGGMVYRESDAEAPGEEVVVADVDGVELGHGRLLRPAVSGAVPDHGGAWRARVSLPAAFTVPTGRAHWEVLVRARAIENQVFVIAAGQIGRHPPDHESYGHSMIVDPWGAVLAQAPDEECFVAADLDLDAQREVREKLPSLANRQPQRLPLAGPGRRAHVSTRRDGAADKRRVILDAAIRVFAREGFHRCRVSDIAREANVAYGLVYHYFRSKDEVLDTLFTERWSLLLEAITEADRSDAARARQAARDRRLHHRLLQQRSRPDEGDHRGGDPRREHVRARAPGGDPPGLRRDQPRSSPTARRTARFAPTSRGVRDPLLLRRDRAAADRLDLRGDPDERRRVRSGQADAGRDVCDGLAVRSGVSA